MQNDRNKLIIEEIKHWKDNQLLPAHYCDFLLALYTFGEGVEEESSDKSTPHKRKIWALIDLLILILLLPISFLLISIFSDQLIVQLIGFAIIFLLIVGHWIYFHRTHSSYVHVTRILLFMILLVSTTSFVYKWTGNGLWLNGMIAFHAIIWMIYGYWKRLSYFLISGAIGILLLFVLIVI